MELGLILGEILSRRFQKKHSIERALTGLVWPGAGDDGFLDAWCEGFRTPACQVQ
jgi:hypothetical protein